MRKRGLAAKTVARIAEQNATGLKKCGTCGERKVFECFHALGRAPDGLKSECAACAAVRSLEYDNKPENKAKKAALAGAFRAKPEYRVKKRAWAAAYNAKPAVRAGKAARNRLYKYNITKDEYDAKLIAQGGLCDICTCELTGDSVPSTDHCHALGHNRGILCRRCNTRIGAVESGFLVRDLAYIARHGSPNPLLTDTVT